MVSYLAVAGGLAALLWSATRFVEGSAVIARHYGIPPLLIGMVIVGFGTSAPEMVVSVLAAYQGNSGIALGNAYGSNITNIALILGLVALVSPIAVQSGVLRTELPILTAVTGLAAWQVSDGQVSRPEAWGLLAVFAGLMVWSIRRGLSGSADALGDEIEHGLQEREMTSRQAWWRLVIGLLVLVLSSRVLVWGAVAIARDFGVSDLIVGLTIVAIGTSLPELASSVVAARRGEHDIALGNVLGSNLFNTLAVVGLAGAVAPLSAEAAVFTRDIAVMGGLTVALFVIGYGWRRQGRINRFEGAALLGAYGLYLASLIRSAAGSG